MERKNKITAVAKETGLARTTPWNFGWFEDMDRWFDNVRRTFEDRFWGGPLARWTGSDAPVREPLVDLIDKGSEYVVRAEVPGVSKEDVDLTVTQDGIEIRAQTKGPARRTRRTTITPSGPTRPSSVSSASRKR